MASSTGDERTVTLTVKWSGSEYVVTLPLDASVGKLKEAIHEKTGVRPPRQKLMGLKCTNKKAATDDTSLSFLVLKPGAKIMMVGTREDDLADVLGPPPDVGEVVNDLVDVPEAEELAVHKQEVYLQKIERRIKEYELKVLNAPRPGKKLLVLDVDATLFDDHSTVERVLDLMRPFLHEFLESVYTHYDIVIWSATSMTWVEAKMRELGVLAHEQYKVVCLVDSLAMISVYLEDRGLTRTKPLAVLWGKLPQYNSKNTIIVDDLRRNFLMNPQNGFKIRPYRRALENRAHDRELLKLGEYLMAIANLEDLSSLDHRQWESYKKP